MGNNYQIIIKYNIKSYTSKSYTEQNLVYVIKISKEKIFKTLSRIVSKL